MTDLFDGGAAAESNYSAQDIQVLEGLEAVRARPGMYIGGTDEQSLHHLVAEILDNSMDEAVAGFANRIELSLNADYSVTVTDNGRGIPVDSHPKYPDRSALEVIMTMLHSGGKFGGNAYKVSGGLHGVGSSVVNALSESLTIEVARDRKLYRQHYAKGRPLDKLETLSPGSRSMAPKAPTCSMYTFSKPVSSASTRLAASSTLSSFCTNPPISDHSPIAGSKFLFSSSTGTETAAWKFGP